MKGICPFFDGGKYFYSSRMGEGRSQLEHVFDGPRWWTKRQSQCCDDVRLSACGAASG
jgi:hypothetical protein